MPISVEFWMIPAGHGIADLFWPVLGIRGRCQQRSAEKHCRAGRPVKLLQRVLLIFLLRKLLASCLRNAIKLLTAAKGG